MDTMTCHDVEKNILAFLVEALDVQQHLRFCLHIHGCNACKIMVGMMVRPQLSHLLGQEKNFETNPERISVLLALWQADYNLISSKEWEEELQVLMDGGVPPSYVTQMIENHDSILLRKTDESERREIEVGFLRSKIKE